eukprot:m.489893 g.489893  ORF g.489893 m.489893 type:complete len:84 (+) comp27245_c0_seq1:116-367(+)
MIAGHRHGHHTHGTSAGGPCSQHLYSCTAAAAVLYRHGVHVHVHVVLVVSTPSLLTNTTTTASGHTHASRRAITKCYAKMLLQ